SSSQLICCPASSDRWPTCSARVSSAACNWTLMCSPLARQSSGPERRKPKSSPPSGSASSWCICPRRCPRTAAKASSSARAVNWFSCSERPPTNSSRTARSRVSRVHCQASPRLATYPCRIIRVYCSPSAAVRRTSPSRGAMAGNCRRVRKRPISVSGCTPGMTLPVARAQLVFLRIQILLLARQRLALAQLEARIHAPQPRTHGGQRHADEKTGSAAVVQKAGVDIRGVDEEVGAVAIAPGWLVQLGEVFLQLGLGIAPGEIGIALAEADLAQPGHHRRAGKGLGQEDHLRVATAHLGAQLAVAIADQHRGQGHGPADQCLGGKAAFLHCRCNRFDGNP